MSTTKRNDESTALFFKGAVFAIAAVDKREGSFPDLTIDELAKFYTYQVDSEYNSHASIEEKRELYFLHGVIVMLAHITRERGGDRGLTDSKLFNKKITVSQKLKEIFNIIWGNRYRRTQRVLFTF